MASFLPLGQRVLVEIAQEESKTASGIIIPDNAKEKPSQAAVVAVSNEVKEDGEIKQGDNVVFGKYSGTEISVDGSKYLVLDVDDIVGILN